MNNNSLRINKNDIKAALHTSLPIMVTFVVLGAGFGILMNEHGFGPLWSILSGIVIFSGTVQFVSVTMLGTGSYRFLVTLFDQVSWVFGSFLGGLIGSVINFDSTGIDFAMTALFTTVFIQQWIDSKCHIPAILGLLATFICRLIFGRELFLIPAMVIIIGVLTVMRRKIEDEGGTDDGRV